MRWRTHKYDHTEFKDKVLSAFKAVRKYGIYARANFMCCRSCASYDLFTKAKDKEDILGAVYYCKQAEEHLNEKKPGKGDLYISFGVSEGGELKSLKDAYIGKLLVMCLQDVGLHPDWNGDENDAIYVSEEIEANQPIDMEACISDICTD